MLEYLGRLLASEQGRFTVTIRLEEGHTWAELPVRGVDSAGIAVDYAQAVHCVPWTSIKTLRVNAE